MHRSKFDLRVTGHMWQLCSVSRKAYISTQLISNVLGLNEAWSYSFQLGFEVEESRSPNPKRARLASPNASCSFQCPASLFFESQAHIGSERKRMRTAQQPFVSSDFGLSLDNKTATSYTNLWSIFHAMSGKSETSNRRDLVGSSQQ